MLKRYFISFLLFIFSIYLYAQTPKYSNEFMSIGVGARALGMSNANVAIVNDVTSGYWNPAGLSLTPSSVQIALMHSEYFAGIAKYDYGAISARIDATSTLGFTFIRFGIDDIPDTSELIDSEGNINYDKIKSFSSADYGFLFSYSKKSYFEGFRYGANAKIIHRKAGDFANAWGFGFDIGAQYDINNWKFGVLGKDITSTFNAWSFDLNDKMKETFSITGNEIPENSLEVTLPQLILGVGKKINIYHKKIYSLIATDFNLTFDGQRNVLVSDKTINIDPRIGIELSYNDFLFVRGGICNIQNETDITGKKFKTFQPNLGIGIKIKNILTIDYALTDIGNTSIALYSNVFSLKFNINKISVSSFEL